MKNNMEHISKSIQRNMNKLKDYVKPGYQEKAKQISMAIGKIDRNVLKLTEGIGHNT